MLHACRMLLGFIGGYTVFDNHLLGMLIIGISLVLCLVEEK